MAPSPEVEELKALLIRLGSRLESIEDTQARLAKAAVHKEEVLKETQEGGSEPYKELAGAVEQIKTTLADDVAPVVNELKAAAPTIKSLCDLYPELCKIAEEHKAKPPEPAEVEAPPKAETETSKDAHTLLLEALNQVGMEALGHPPSWGDLLDLCPDGNCAQAAARAIAKRPQLLDYMAGQEAVAEAMLEALKKAGKVVVEEPLAPLPETPPDLAQPEEVATDVRERGIFSRIPA